MKEIISQGKWSVLLSQYSRIVRKPYSPAILLPILLLGTFLRLWISDFKAVFPDYDPFYHARIAEIVYSTRAIPSWDAQELGGIPHYYPPVFHVLIAFGKYLLPSMGFIEIGSIINVLFGVLSILIVYLMAREQFNEKIGLLSALLFAVTPMAVFRASLWARPLGLATFLMAMCIYSFLRFSKKPDQKNGLLLLSSMLVYMFSHSSFILAFCFLALGAIINHEKKLAKAFVGITCLAALLGMLYYSRFIPYLNFSPGYTAEYRPIVTLSDITSRLQPMASVLYLSAANLIYLPFLMHGAILCFKEKNYFICTLIAIAVPLAFFKGSLFLLSIFVLCIAIALSLSRMSEYASNGIRYGLPLAALMLVAMFSLHILMNASIHDEKPGGANYARIMSIKEVLEKSSLTSKDVVLADKMAVGHSIAYYSNASTFMSVLTDTKQWDKNYEAYKRLRDENLTFSQADAILTENGITHLLMVGEATGFSFVQNSTANLEIVNAAKSTVLYKIKK